MNAYARDENLSAGTWQDAQSSTKRTALFKCPNGHIGSLSGHDIAQDGTVSPSVVCPEDGCDFHEFIKLKGWEGV